MTVRDLLIRDAATCAPRVDLEQVVQLMLERDCGFIPVIDPDGSVAGVVTDRDICVALAAHRRTPAHVTAEEAMTHPVFACLVDDDVATALKTMRDRRIRRLPVLNRAGRMQGVISINDIVLATQQKGGPAIEDTMAAMRAICRHREALVMQD
jgi:CBS domain-containing protein